MQDASSGHRGWLKQSKLAVKEETAVGLAAEGGFSSTGGDVVTSLMTVSATSAPTLMAAKNKSRSMDFRPRMGLREEGKKMRKKVEYRKMWKGWYVNQRDFFL